MWIMLEKLRQEPPFRSLLPLYSIKNPDAAPCIPIFYVPFPHYFWSSMFAIIRDAHTTFFV